MSTSFLTRLAAAFLIIAASPGLVRASEPGDSKLPEAFANEETRSHITLEQAVSRALGKSPSLAARTSAVSAAEARIIQAGLLPNPELELETENFGGSGELDGFNAAESTAVVSQPVLLGGKRRHRQAVAESEHALAGRDLEAIRLDVSAGTTSAFFRVLAAQQRVQLVVELQGLAEQFARTVQARVDAGKVSPVEAKRASIEVAQARVRLARATRGLQAARALLASHWGSSEPDFDRALGALPKPAAPPTLTRIRHDLSMTPEMMRLEDLVERQQRIVDLEKSFRIPDLTVSLGPRRFEETGQSAWVIGISLPIPIFDRNQGSRLAAEFELERTRNDIQAVRIALETNLETTLERLRVAALEATTMYQDVVPAAADLLTATENGYSMGKFGLLTVLDAQGALFEARTLHLDSLEEYALASTELERLIGRSAINHDDTAQGGLSRNEGEGR
jgi:cobalt-zinc-cadmium efflux system outer membrane protein